MEQPYAVVEVGVGMRKRKRKQTALWKMKDGERIRLCDMTDSHLDNTIKFLQRVVHTREIVDAMDLESMFERASEDDLLGELEDEWHECNMPPIYKRMLLEKKRRDG